MYAQPHKQDQNTAPLPTAKAQRAQVARRAPVNPPKAVSDRGKFFIAHSISVCRAEASQEAGPVAVIFEMMASNPLVMPTMSPVFYFKAEPEAPAHSIMMELCPNVYQVDPPTPLK